MNNTSPASPASPTIAPDVALLDRARTALGAGDLAGFRAAAATTADIGDPHRRYVARRTLVDLGLRRARETGDGRPALLHATADVALTVLDAAPAEPVLLNLAGVTLFELGSLAGATKLLRAAADLDPAIPGLSANLDQIRDLRRRKLTLRAMAGVEQAVPALERRAAAIAGRAKLAQPGRISLCMIVRDEEERLGRCLASAAGVADEIIVVDTGSQDGTVAIAREHGAVVLEHAWDDDFSAARNVGLDAASGDWVLFLDADEALVADDAPKVRELTRRPWIEGYTLTIVNRVGSGRDGAALSQDVLRLFRNRAAHRFEGRIHEGVLHAMPADAPERLAPAGVRIDHDGYLQHVRDAKGATRRNLELLERQLSENPPSAYLHFNIGSEYLAAGAPAAALEHLRTAWKLQLAQADPAGAPFAPALAARLAATLRETGDGAEAVAVAERGLELFPGYTDLVLEQALVARATGDLDTAEALLRRCLELGDAPSRYAALKGAGGHLAATILGDVLTQRGDASAAADLLAPVVAEHPEHDQSRIALASALVTLGRFADAAETVAPLPAASPWSPAAQALTALARDAGGDAPLSIGALNALVPALRSRLAAHDVDGFVALLPLASRLAGFGDRDRRELLATLYLDHGFLDSAADEWAAACDEHGPDAEALSGLAKVAAARGDVEDARVFAEAALELAAA